MSVAKSDIGEISTWRSIGRRLSSPTVATALVAVVVAAIIVAVALLLRGQPKDVIVGLGAALASAVVALVLALVNSLERKRERKERQAAADREESERANLRHEQRAYSALNYFDGGTQRRNIGISVVEGISPVVPEIRKLYLPLLVNQAGYLLLVSKQEEAAHEVDNCTRIVRLIIAWKSDLGDSYSTYYKQLQDSLRKRLEPPAAYRRRGGIEMESNDLQRWYDDLA
ncbi:hypothetical protein [Pseudonocardia charpentierae]|uniref:DUF4760 domain-containing protein n=1 Tax=Pseudonocardia charpentierae TaxID=3075545 RepID=A0ABU2NI05_9PSEU|nr:hypothetical protein [Pseudonocardia sp. DSM 45834]MDT0353598.1 hypothetical protein [Pseudonocardia sp. DSM 45834]